MRLLQHPGLDAVVVATPPSQHLDMVTRALDAGKHVLVEKPFALNSADGARMRDKAKAAGKTAMIAEAYRFAPARAYAKELIDQGYIGKLQTLAISLFLGPRQRPEPAGPRLHWRSSNETGGGFSAGPASTFFDSVLDWFGDIGGGAGQGLSGPSRRLAAGRLTRGRGRIDGRELRAGQRRLGHLHGQHDWRPSARVRSST